MPDFGTIATALGLSGGWAVAVILAGFNLYLLITGKLVPRATIQQIERTLDRTIDERDHWQRNAERLEVENLKLTETAMRIGQKTAEALPLALDQLGGHDVQA